LSDAAGLRLADAAWCNGLQRAPPAACGSKMVLASVEPSDTGILGLERAITASNDGRGDRGCLRWSLCAGYVFT